jgi:hypothetical protein
MAVLSGMAFRIYETPSGTFAAGEDGLIIAVGRAINELLACGCDLVQIAGPTGAAGADGATGPTGPGPS